MTLNKMLDEDADENIHKPVHSSHTYGFLASQLCPDKVQPRKVNSLTGATRKVNPRSESLICFNRG